MTCAYDEHKCCFFQMSHLVRDITKWHPWYNYWQYHHETPKVATPNAQRLCMN